MYRVNENDVKRKIGTRRYCRAMYVEETTLTRDDVATEAMDLLRDAERAEILI
jgi:hypothetical protein